jgi:asparagine synthase (glutamine-hydrolysing)
MCGIAGIIGNHADTPDVRAMTAALHHRGPDCQAAISLPHAHLGAARLRIVDLHRGDQPLVSARTGAVLVFNGEIYNYRDLRSHLEARGHRFDTSTDSEVVLRAYEEWGWRAVERLRGMYAFAIADGDKAVLARDPWGIKPLHYTVLRHGRTIAFASEVKALLRCPEVRAEIDEATLGDLSTLEYVADPTATLFKDIRSLEPGYCLEIDLADPALTRRAHCFLPALERFDPPPTTEEAESRIDELLEAAVRSHQMADVPICLTLSGGLDSTLLGLFLRQQVGAGVVSYGVGDDAGHADLQQAAHVARELGFEHHTVLFTFRQYLDAMAPAILAGETFTDGVQEYLLFREVGSRFRVALNGEGADELFGGYPEHWRTEQYLARLRNAAASLPLTERGAIERDRLLSTPAIDGDAWMLRHFMGSQLTDRHLQPLDKLSMASSVEVRVPYLDYDLASYVQRLPTSLRVNRTLGTLKYILRRVYLRRWKATPGAADMVDAVLRQKFGFPDARQRSEDRFHVLCDRVLPETYFRDHPWRRFLAHSRQAMWFDLFQFLFCERRGSLPPEFDLLDFVAERAGKATATVASVFDEVAGGTRENAGQPQRSAGESSHLFGFRSEIAERPEAGDPARAPDPAEVAENESEAVTLLEKRLCEIVEAVGGREVGTNGRELWFLGDLKGPHPLPSSTWSARSRRSTRRACTRSPRHSASRRIVP